MPMNDNLGEMQPLINITTLVYVLQALSFFLGVTCIVAIIINYVKRPEVGNTWLASHFRWQMRTFWFGLLWMAMGGLIVILAAGYLIITITGIGMIYLAAGYLVITTTGIWMIYRIAKGWLYLNDGKPLYAADNH